MAGDRHPRQMTTRPPLRGRTELGLSAPPTRCPLGVPTGGRPALTTPFGPNSAGPYPASWEARADIRVLRAPASQWEKLIQWRADTTTRAWRLLKVTSEGQEIIAVFGRPRSATSSSGVAP